MYALGSMVSVWGWMGAPAGALAAMGTIAMTAAAYDLSGLKLLGGRKPLAEFGNLALLRAKVMAFDVGLAAGWAAKKIAGERGARWDADLEEARQGAVESAMRASAGYRGAERFATLSIAGSIKEASDALRYADPASAARQWMEVPFDPQWPVWTSLAAKKGPGGEPAEGYELPLEDLGEHPNPKRTKLPFAVALAAMLESNIDGMEAGRVAECKDCLGIIAAMEERKALWAQVGMAAVGEAVSGGDGSGRGIRPAPRGRSL
jgi:hypothetical protein